MKYVLSLPRQVSSSLAQVKKINEDWQAFSDPPDSQLGSGGGTAWLLYKSFISEGVNCSFSEWLSKEKRVLVHAGGLSRRLPSYAPVGKSLIPVPVFRWERGQRLDQTLIDLQLPLAEKLLDSTSNGMHTLVVSGDALVTTEQYNFNIPEVDVVLLAVSVDSSVAMNHGVFVCDSQNPENLILMLQKPSHQQLQQVAMQHLFFIDTGVWLLSDRAIHVLMKKSGWQNDSNSFIHQIPQNYDLYGSFGLSLGNSPTIEDADIENLTVAVIPLNDGEFFHFGTNSEIISSSLRLQNKVQDQRLIWSRNIKPHPSIFTQNAIILNQLSEQLHNVWIENSYIPASWQLHGNHVITGIPENSWTLDVPEGICLDMVPLGEDSYAIRPYGMYDVFRGDVGSPTTKWMNDSIGNWFLKRGLSKPSSGYDIYDYPLFPIVSIKEMNENFIQWMFIGTQNLTFSEFYSQCLKVSATNILAKANISRSDAQRIIFRKQNYVQLLKNYKKSVFYQIDLRRVAKEIEENSITTIHQLSVHETPLLSMHDNMFRSLVTNDKRYENRSFSILREVLIDPIRNRKVLPSCSVYLDQIVWSRSPVRIDLAGGWTDTPPYSLLHGGDVVTVALELNGQPPLQAYVRPVSGRHITLRSIDQGSELTIMSFQDLSSHNNLNSGFSIPKAALCLAGFHPDFCSVSYNSLQQQLNDIGSGFELTFFSSVPRGSGLGTSSILSATILGALSDFCGLGWDLYEIGDRTLALEQLLTSGGGWQDQYGGIFPGIKHLHTKQGVRQIPEIKWLPDTLFKNPEYKDCMLLYYTGITRVAKNLLGEIVKGMFLNDSHDTTVLREMKFHACHTAELIQKHDFQGFGQAIAKTWKLKNKLDKDTNNSEIQQIIDLINDYALGYILPGAGGGGFLFILGKDIISTNQIRRILNEYRIRKSARIVEMDLSNEGMKVTRS